MGFSIDDIKAFIIRHYQYFLVGILFVCLVIILAVFSGKSRKGADTDKKDSQEATESTGYEVPDVALEKDTYPAVNDLVSRYYNAMASGDTATLLNICSELDEKEQIRIEQKAEYTDSYGNFTCYTKPGPEAGSYIVFAYYEIKFKNIETLAPGLTTLYVKTADDGSLYVYDGPLSTEMSDYIRAITAQDDVVDLLNEVDAKYTAAADSDDNLKNFMEALPTALDDAVSAELAAREAAAREGEAEEQTEPQVLTAKISDTINVRKSPSTDGDKMGQLMAGDTVTVTENMDNGWSRIDYQGEEAYVKTEYLEMNTGEDGGDTANETPAQEQQPQEQPKPQSIGKVSIKGDNTRIRSGASTDAGVLGTESSGASFDLIGTESNWFKIDYKGQTGYVRDDCATKN